MDEQTGSNIVSVGVDLSEFYMSVEWDILEVPAVRSGQTFGHTTTCEVKCGLLEVTSVQEIPVQPPLE
ncbi:unnamed protein product [Pieris macdunnoughi]|uniref:Uncharacterized protein n=1 Tax=Pieris macdunnoughi TaxID=345717 RepID=A0A821Q5P6_9NEOP|nr:unnamed protein product [Pieris macdunnoughi]